MTLSEVKEIILKYPEISGCYCAVYVFNWENSLKTKTFKLFDILFN